MAFAVFCKSFRDDLSRCARLVDSVEAHNRGGLPFYLCVPTADRGLFVDRLGTGRFELMTDEEVLQRDVRQSWYTQQLVKLAVWRTGFAERWLWIDSDSYFIRDFSLADFISDDGDAAFVASSRDHVIDDQWDAIVEHLRDADAGFDALTNGEMLRGRGASLTVPGLLARLKDAVWAPAPEARLPRIQAFFGRIGARYNFLPGPVWTRECLESLEREVLTPHALRFEDLLAIAPWEAFWVGEWEIFRGLPRRYVRQPYVVHIRDDATIARMRRARIGEADLARRYLAVTLAARHQAIETLDPR